jgi:hypothetical protein
METVIEPLGSDGDIAYGYTIPSCRESETKVGDTQMDQEMVSRADEQVPGVISRDTTKILCVSH